MPLDADCAFRAPDLDLPPVDADHAPRWREGLTAMPDPRSARRRLYPLPILRRTALWAVTLGADGGRSIARRCEKRLSPRRRCRDLPCGTPSHHTCRRVFGLRDPALGEAAVRPWVAGLRPDPAGDGVAIDGQRVRGSRARTHDRPPLPRVGVGSPADRLGRAPPAVPDPAHAISVRPARLSSWPREGGAR